MIKALAGQLMAFVEDVKTVLRCGEYHASTEPQIRQHEIMVGHNDVRVVQPLSRTKKTALPHVRTPPASALALIRGHELPDLRLQMIGPRIKVTIPLTLSHCLKHLLKHRRHARRI